MTSVPGALPTPRMRTASQPVVPAGLGPCTEDVGARSQVERQARSVRRLEFQQAEWSVALLAAFAVALPAALVDGFGLGALAPVASLLLIYRAISRVFALLVGSTGGEAHYQGSYDRHLNVVDLWMLFGITIVMVHAIPELTAAVTAPLSILTILGLQMVHVLSIRWARRKYDADPASPSAA